MAMEKLVSNYEYYRCKVIGKYFNLNKVHLKRRRSQTKDMTNV